MEKHDLARYIGSFSEVLMLFLALGLREQIKLSQTDIKMLENAPLQRP